MQDNHTINTTGSRPNPVEQRELLARILASELFSKSHRLCAFLKFICEQSLLGKADTVHEQRIGTEVFGRPAGYHVGEDSIVRSQARFLRQRLEEYFAGEGREERIVLSIPKGSYLPAFERREVQASVSTPAAGTFPALGNATVWGMGLVATLALLALIASAWVWWTRTPVDEMTLSQSPAVRAFWTSLLNSGRPVVVVPADSTLVLMEEVTGRPVHLLSYINKDYLREPDLRDPEVWRLLSGSQYTSMADLNLVARLERVPEVRTAQISVRYARDLNLKELKDGNDLLIGGRRSNPWVELYQSALNFEVDYDPETQHNEVQNRTPAHGEQRVYVEDTSGVGGDSHAYGVIAYVPGLDNLGHALLVEGTSKVGTEAAAEFLNGPGFADFLRQAGGSGTHVPNFELLLVTGTMDGASYHPALVCWHLLPVGNSK